MIDVLPALNFIFILIQDHCAFAQYIMMYVTRNIYKHTDKNYWKSRVLARFAYLQEKQLS